MKRLLILLVAVLAGCTVNWTGCTSEKQPSWNFQAHHYTSPGKSPQVRCECIELGGPSVQPKHIATEAPTIMAEKLYEWREDAGIQR